MDMHIYVINETTNNVLMKLTRMNENYYGLEVIGKREFCLVESFQIHKSQLERFLNRERYCKFRVREHKHTSKGLISQCSATNLSFPCKQIMLTFNV